MSHTSLLLGPTLAGKSSMIASAILHAARLCAQGRRIELNRSAMSSAGVGLSQYGTGVAHRIEETGACFWRPDETLQIGSSVELDSYAQRLWLRWLYPDSGVGGGQVAMPHGSGFSVTEIGSDLLGLRNSSTATRRLRFIEVSGSLFRALGDSAGKLGGHSQALAVRRLDAVLIHADVVTVCLGATDAWSNIDLRAVRHILIACKKLRPSHAVTNLVVTKTDVWLSELAYRAGRTCFEPDALWSERHAGELLRSRLRDDGLWRLAKETPGLGLRLASSFGLLTASGTCNVDLVGHTQPVGVNSEPTTLRPLWPQRGSNPRHLLPSVPETLAHWRPIGAVEALLNAEVPNYSKRPTIYRA